MEPKASIAFDLEWDANSPGRELLALGFGFESYEPEKIPKIVLNALRDEEVAKIVFTKADHRWMQQHRFPVAGPIIDVQVMAWCYDERTPLDLDWCVKNYLGIDPDKRVYRHKGQVWFRTDSGVSVLIADAPKDQLLAYNTRDIDYTGRLYVELKRRLMATGQWEYFELLHQPFSKVLLDMELNGLPIDVPKTKKLALALSIEASAIEKDLKYTRKLPEQFNLNSSTQLADVLFQKEFTLPAKLRPGPEGMAKLREGEWPDNIPTNFKIEKLGRELIHGEFELKGWGLTPKVKAPKCALGQCGHPKGECVPSTAGKVLKVYYGDHPWVRELVEYKATAKAQQFLTSWLELQEGGRIFTHFNQTGTATGRLSSSDPLNLQNIPARGHLGKMIRRLFVPSPGHVFVNGDFSQIEPRLMAHFSGDPVLCQIFENGEDLYNITCAAILGDSWDGSSASRQLIKGCFLALSYGAQPKKIRSVLAEQGFFFPLSKVEEAHEGLISLYSGFWKWREQVIKEGRSKGYVETIAGHRRHLDFGGAGGWKAELQAVNSKIQGSAADIVAATMIMAAESLPHWKMILQVHDEIMFEATPGMALERDVELFRTIAEGGHGYDLDVPLVFEPKILESWGDK